jgi:CheY-like chemotaxis protein
MPRVLWGDAKRLRFDVQPADKPGRRRGFVRGLSMTDDLVALKVLSVCDSAAERDALKEAAAQASVMVDVVEVDRSSGVQPICHRLKDGAIDAVFLDDRMSHDVRRVVVDAARAAEAKPLVISVGMTDLQCGQVAAEGLAWDGVLAKPVQLAEARAVLNACVRARLPNRVLVVDDSPTMRSVIRKVLQSSRYRLEIEEACDGPAAIELTEQRRFDVVLLDCNMPGFDGFATLEKLLKERPDTKVVMITATNDTKLADRARAAGAHSILYKPFYAKDIDNMMSVVVGLRRPAP